MSQDLVDSGWGAKAIMAFRQPIAVDPIMYVLLPCQSLTLSPILTRCGVTTSNGILADTFGTVPTIHDLAVSALHFVRLHKPNNIRPRSSCVVR